MSKDTITSWSYSRYSTYTGCPRKAYFSYVLKIKTPEVPAMARGTEIHEQAEDFMCGTHQNLPESLHMYREEFETLRENFTNIAWGTEIEWAFNKKWGSTGWFDEDCWLRIKVDLAYKDDDENLTVVDYKTGKVRDNYQEQLSLYALGAFLSSDVRRVKTQLWFLDHGHTTTVFYNREDVGVLKKNWNNRVARMMKDKYFLPTPGYMCRFCDYSKSKGGQCEY